MYRIRQNVSLLFTYRPSFVPGSQPIVRGTTADYPNKGKDNFLIPPIWLAIWHGGNLHWREGYQGSEWRSESIDRLPYLLCRPVDSVIIETFTKNEDASLNTDLFKCRGFDSMSQWRCSQIDRDDYEMRNCVNFD